MWYGGMPSSHPVVCFLSFFLSLTNAHTHTAHTKFARRRCVLCSSGRRHSTDWKAASSCVSQPKEREEKEEGPT